MVFVVIDGLDASGKSTQAELLAGYLTSRGGSVVLRTHPSGDSCFGRISRGYLMREGGGAHAMAGIFYLLDVLRSIVLYRWRPSRYIVFVRYLLGTAYLPAPLHKLAYLFFSRVVPRPTKMIFLQITPDEAFRRTGSRLVRERFESFTELETVDRRVRDLVLYGGWTIVEGGRPTDTVQESIRAALQS